MQKRLREVEDPEKRPKPSFTLTTTTTIVEQLVATALVEEQIPCWAL